ncbi:sugar ABC transporter permease [Pelosinus sp. UFO1]|uniref:sugar ABC transporter permease n=1 Tax=Pelosinus sp. UFO1 TaxID=484770 RepID=UPI0004D165A7|nr:sugar ABC transporter permease [Pelosinus sp. UFO1]AIF51595.1 ABC-type transporter, integral membrane subunit [Pelosinus sp. UFO1]
MGETSKVDARTNNIQRTNSFKEILVGSIKNNIRQYTMGIALLTIWLIFTILTDGIFITSRNLSNLFLQSCTIAILASGMVLVMVAGHIDLSVGSIAGFLGAVAAVLMVKMNVDTVPAILITLLIGLLIGLWQGYWIAYRGVPAFIVTLASMMAFKGAIIGVTSGASIGPMNTDFKAIGQGYVPKLFFQDLSLNDTSAFISVGLILLFILFEFRRRQVRIRYGFQVLPMPLQITRIVLISLAMGLVLSIMVGYRGIPYAIILLIGIVALFSFIAEKTTFGRHVYAIGGNKEAARLSGININKTNLMIFVIMGVLTAVAGIVFTARLNAATTAAGNLFELDAIAAAVIGGTSTLGGEGTILGAIIGALVMASLDNGMSLMNLDITFQYVIKGLILLLAVWVDIATRKRS